MAEKEISRLVDKNETLGRRAPEVLALAAFGIVVAIRLIRFVRQDHQNYIGHLRLDPSRALCRAQEIADRRGRSVGLIAPGTWDLSEEDRVLFSDGFVQLVLVKARTTPPACTA